MTRHLFKYSCRQFLKYHLPYFLFTGTILVTSCEKKHQQLQTEENKIVVLAEIIAGDSAYIPVSVSRKAGNSDVVRFEKPVNAALSITGADGTQRNLLLNTNPDYNEIPSAVYTHPAIFKPDMEYILSVSVPASGAVTATTRIPEPFNVGNVKTDESSLNGRDVFDFKFQIEDNIAEENYYIFEAVKQIVTVRRYFYWGNVRYDYDTPAGKDLYENLEDDDEEVDVKTDTVFTNKFIRLNIFTNDNNSDNKSIGPLDSSFRRIFINDVSFNGHTYSGRFSVIMDHFTATDPKEKGVVLIRIKSVDKDYYDYMLRYEKYKTDFGTRPVSMLTTPPGNIPNGLGIFGGSYKREWKYYYDELE